MNAAVIFDCDGTLVDSEPLAGGLAGAPSRATAMRSPTSDLAACVGTPYARTHAYFSERAPLPGRGRAVAGDLAELFALIDAQLQPFPDALETLAELHARGVPDGRRLLLAARAAGPHARARRAARSR